MSKRTLITKLHQDVSLCNDAQIEAFKAFMIASFAPAGLEPSFEVIEENEESFMEQMLRLVRSEFKEHDEPSKEGEELPVIRIESNGVVLPFPAGNDKASEGDDTRDE